MNKYCFVIILIFLPLLTVEGQNLYRQSKYEFGASAGVMLPGQVIVRHNSDATLDADLTSEAAFLLRLYFDIIYGRTTSIGVFFNYSDFAFTNSPTTASLTDTGIAFKYRFLLNKTMAIRPGAGLGYRFFGASDTAIENGGLATNLSLEFIWALTENNLKLLADVGLFAQPYGQSDEYDVFIPSLPYVTLGVAFLAAKSVLRSSPLQ
jgi:hypothetical protein